MEAIDISKAELRKLILNETIFHSEGDIFLYTENGEHKAIKKLHRPNGIYFSNKLYTINTLIDKKDRIDIKELILPERLVVSDKSVIGYSMPYIDGIDLSILLNSENIDIKEKIKYLKQIGTILRKMVTARQRLGNANFYLNYLHESNFVVKNDILYAVDIDSCSIMGNYPFGTKYLSSFSPLYELPQKYNRDLTISCGGDFIPDENTDLYCYNIIVLNLLFKYKMNTLSKSEFDKCLNFLGDIGLNKELIDAFSKLYTTDDNVNIDNLLDYIPEVFDKIKSYKRI